MKISKSFFAAFAVALILSSTASAVPGAAINFNDGDPINQIGADSDQGLLWLAHEQGGHNFGGRTPGRAVEPGRGDGREFRGGERGGERREGGRGEVRGGERREGERRESERREIREADRHELRGPMRERWGYRYRWGFEGPWIRYAGWGFVFGVGLWGVWTAVTVAEARASCTDYYSNLYSSNSAACNAEASACGFYDGCETNRVLCQRSAAMELQAHYWHNCRVWVNMPAEMLMAAPPPADIPSLPPAPPAGVQTYTLQPTGPAQ